MYPAARAENQYRRAAIDGIAGSHYLFARLEEVLRTDRAMRGNTLYDREYGAHRGGYVNIAGAVERIYGHYIGAGLRERGQTFIFLTEEARAYAAAPAEVHDDVIAEIVELLYGLALHIGLSGAAAQVEHAYIPDGMRERLSALGYREEHPAEVSRGSLLKEFGKAFTFLH